MLSLEKSVQQARALSFTFERIRRADPPSRLTAVVEPDARPTPTVTFTRQLFESADISIVPLDQIQGLIRAVRQELN